MMRNPGDVNQQGVGRPAHGGGRECRLPAYRCSMIVAIVAFLRHRPNLTMFHISLAYLFGSAKKRMNTFIAYLRVVRLSLALPGNFAGMRLHSAATRTTTVWSRPRPTDFRLAPLSSPARRASQGIPPVLDFPRALAVETPSAQAAITTSPKPVIRDGAALTTRRRCARRMACTSLHVSICTVGEHETASAKCSSAVDITASIVSD